MAKRSSAPLSKDGHPLADKEEGNIPLIEAVAIDTPPDSQAQTKTADTDDPSRRVFQVVAPANLPKGYRLNVFVEETTEEVVVLVPAGGVKRSQKFEGKEARPLTGDWSDDVFDCCSNNNDGSFFSVACCFPVVGWGIIIEKLGGRNPTEVTMMPIPWFMGFLTLAYVIVYFLQIHVAKFGLMLVFAIFAASVRGAVRKQYKIPGN